MSTPLVNDLLYKYIQCANMCKENAGKRKVRLSSAAKHSKSVFIQVNANRKQFY